MRLTVREALSACSQVQRGGSDGLNQTICPSQPDTFLWRKPNPGMQIYTWCQKRCVCLGVEGKILCAAIVFIAAYSYSMYCWVCSDLRLIFFFQQISVWCHELATAGVCWLSGFACVPTACMHSQWLWVLAYPHNREIVLKKSTHRVQDKDDQTPSMDFQNNTNQSSCDQAARFVCNWRVWEKRTASPL